jgi:CHAT domain-containing protein/tetratricopeptide (TPR) repeat protein
VKVSGAGLGVVLLLGILQAGPARSQDAFRVYADLPADSTEARRGIIAGNPPGFAADFDSALVATDLSASGSGDLLESAALDFLDVTGDSLLLSDLRFVGNSSPGVIAAWYEAVQADALGLSLRRQGDAEGAIEAYTAAAEAYRDLGHLRREAVCWGSLGVAWWGTGDWEQVRAAYLEALDARERLGDPVLIGRTLNGLGTVAFQQGRYPEALDYYTRARDVRETLGNPVDLAVTTTYLGNVNLRLGNLDEARAGYVRALELLGPDGPARRLNEARGSLALVYNLLGRPDEAMEIHRQVLVSAEAAGDREMEAISRNNLAGSHLALGDPGGALRQLVVVREMEDIPPYVRIHTLSEMGDAYRQLGDLRQALEVLSEAREIAAETENRLESLHLSLQTGVVYQLMGLPDRALVAYQEGQVAADTLGIGEESRGARFAQADVLEAQGEGEEALRLIDEVIASDLEQGFQPYLAADYINRGNALTGLGRLEEGREAYQEGIDLAGGLDLKDELWRGYLGMADNLEQEGQLDSARVHNDLAIETLEQMGSVELSEGTKASLVGKRAFVYEAQINLLAKLHDREPEAGYEAEGFAVAERGKARALLDMLAEGRVDLEAGFDPALVAERDSLDRTLRSARYRLRIAVDEGASPPELRDLKAEVRDLERDQAALQQRMRLANPSFATLDAGQPAGLAEIREVLLPSGNEVLLEYSLGDSASHLWVATRDRLVLHSLPPRTEVEAATQAFRSALRNPAPAGDEALVASSAALFRMILEPAMGATRKAGTVYIVPDGSLHFVPFEALVEAAPAVPDAAASSAARARFLHGLPYALAGRQVLYGPSATTLTLLAETRQSRERGEREMAFLGVGDPVFTAAARSADEPLRGGELAPLPFTGDEVEMIAGLFPPGSATVLVGEEASEVTLSRPGYLSPYRVLHFATHGLVDERRPEKSSLALAFPRDPSEDGYLQASEIYHLQLNADLVVLSACETALGRMVRGEGVLGLPRAFLYAGASSVVVSLWSVSDRSTSELMGGFYEEMIEEGKSPGEALGEAKARLLESESFAHPFYWAPFVMIGPA